MIRKINELTSIQRVAASLSLFFILTAVGPARASEERVWPVKTQPISFADFEVFRDFSGSVTSLSAIDLSFSKAGCIARLGEKVRTGATVKVGDVLFAQDEREARINEEISQASVREHTAIVEEQVVARDGAKARYERELENLSRSKEFLDRDQSLADRNLISKTAADEARRRFWTAQDAAAQALETLSKTNAALRRSQTTLERVKAEANSASYALDLLTIKAPYDGQIVSLNVSPGTCVTAGQSLAVIARPDDRQLEMFLPLSAMDGAGTSGAQLGTRVDVRKANGQSCPGTISGVSGQVLAETQLVAVEVSINAECAPMFRLNEAVEVRLALQKFEDVVRLPHQSVREADQVFVVGADNRLKLMPLDYKQVTDGMAYVRFDAADASRVVVAPPALAIDGMLVEPVDIDE